MIVPELLAQKSGLQSKIDASLVAVVHDPIKMKNFRWFRYSLCFDLIGLKEFLSALIQDSWIEILDRKH